MIAITDGTNKIKLAIFIQEHLKVSFEQAFLKRNVYAFEECSEPLKS